MFGRGVSSLVGVGFADSAFDIKDHGLGVLGESELQNPKPHSEVLMYLALHIRLGSP